MNVPGLGRASARLRLTLGYGAVFMVSGAALLGVSYLLVSHAEHRKGTAATIACGVVSSGGATGVANATPLAPGNSPQACIRAIEANGGAGVYANGRIIGSLPSTATGGQGQIGQLQAAVSDSQAHTLHTLLIESGVALGLLTVVSVGFGWLIAGRILRPVHRITDTARRLSEETLHDRINLSGPRDELKELADTFDAMLGRLDRAFSSQRRFVANASHELRTPLATERVLIDEALANRGASTEDVRVILEHLRLNSEDTERLIDALLALARSERGIGQRVPVDLAALAEGVVDKSRAEAVTVGVQIRADVEPATALGDQGLLERLVDNLVQNGVRHNHPGGWVTVATSADTGLDAGPGGTRWATLEVANSGRLLNPDTVAGLVEPFRRDGPDRTSDRGFGLGLSIVDAIVSAHGGRLELQAPPDGGLVARVALPSGQSGSGPPATSEDRSTLPIHEKL